MVLSNILRKSSGNAGAPQRNGIVGISSLAAFFVAVWWVSGLESASVSAFVFFVYAVLFFLVRVFYCRISNKEIPTLRKFLVSYASVVGTMFAVGCAYIGAFAIWQNEIDPAPLPEITISNGEKTVRFRTMAHIASPSFYSGVASEIDSLRKDGWAVFYEGVRPGTPENDAKFDRLMGFRFDPDIYASMAKLYGLVPQDSRALLGTPGPNDRNVDVSVDDIIAAAEKRRGSPISLTGSESAPLREISKELSAHADSLNPRELALTRYFNRAFIGMFLKHRNASSAAFSIAGWSDLVAAVLGDRDKVLVDEILKSDQKKIFVTYGLLHFDGVFSLLQDRDPKWKVSEPIRNFYPTRP